MRMYIFQSQVYGLYTVQYDPMTKPILREEAQKKVAKQISEERGYEFISAWLEYMGSATIVE